MNGRFLNSRLVKERIVIEGDLILLSPTHLGNGDPDGVADISLQRDAVSGAPLLTGASLAGALRSYLREHQHGFGHQEDTRQPGAVEKLFGYVAGGKTGEAVLSWLLVDDSIGTPPSGIELRDAVSIDPHTRTAEPGKKFDLELWPAGVRFPLRLELWLPADESAQALLQSLGLALTALQNGEIRLGSRKRRGFGQCKVETWSLSRYPVDRLDALFAWLKQEPYLVKAGADAFSILGISRPTDPGRRKRLQLKAKFTVEGSLLIRSAGPDENAPDAVHLRNLAGSPVLPGTSLAGALRGRALSIWQTFDPIRGMENVNQLFGPHIGAGRETPQGSRLWTSESAIEGSAEIVQSRVMIDRFTGGALPQHLFNEAPLLRGDLEIVIQVDNPSPPEVGLLLLLLKDLWTGDLPLGGEASIGRGRLTGVCADLRLEDQAWRLTQAADGPILVDGDRVKLEDFVKSLVQREEMPQ